MHVINPNAIYTTAELLNMLSGFVKVETLRAYGLVSLPGAGYWGADLIDAVNRMQEERRRRKHGSIPKPARTTRPRGHHASLAEEQRVASEDTPERLHAMSETDLEAAPHTTPSSAKPCLARHRGSVADQKQKLQKLASKPNQ